MNTNISSTLVKITDPKRAQLWQRLGFEQLPVLHPRPRWQSINDRLTYAYDLDGKRLSQAQAARIAGYISRRTGRSYSIVLAEVQENIPVSAAGCVVIQ